MAKKKTNVVIQHAQGLGELPNVKEKIEKFTPINDKVLIEIITRATKEEFSDKKITMIAKGEDKLLPRAKVIEIGADCKKVKVGDTIVYSMHLGDAMELNNKTYLVLREIDIYGIIT